MAVVRHIRPKARVAERAALYIFPNPRVGDQSRFTEPRYVYALGYEDGRTKIGIAWRPRDRFIQHWNAGGALAWAHLFRRFNRVDAIRIERRACALAALESNRVRTTETFLGLSREGAIRCVRAAIAELA